MVRENSSTSDLILEVNVKRKPRFKAGAELTSKVNLVAVDFQHELEEDQEVLGIRLSLNRSKTQGFECP